MKFVLTAILSLLTVSSGCAETESPTKAAIETAQEMTSRSMPDGESVAGTIDGEAFEATTIRECKAVPGIALGFNASTDDYVGSSQNAGLRVGGGFERARARLFADFRGERWTAGEGVDGGPVDFRLSDQRAGSRQFVTVRARGQLMNDAGVAIPIEVNVTCEPGGT